MKKTALKLVAAFEIIYGAFGLTLAAGGVAGMLPYGLVSLLWYGAFPAASLAAGVLLWRRGKFAFVLSALVLLLQVPLIYTGGLLLNLGAPLNLTFSGTWLSREGAEATVLGVNVLALGVLALLLWGRCAWRPVAGDAASNSGLNPTPDQRTS